MRTTSKIEDELKNEQNLKDNLQNEDNIKNEEDLKNEDNQEIWPHPKNCLPDPLP